MNNEAAFPSHWTMGEIVRPGMTLRDYFAGQALAGDWAANQFPINHPHDQLLAIAESYYRMADAMILARGETVR